MELQADEQTFEGNFTDTTAEMQLICYAASYFKHEEKAKKSHSKYFSRSSRRVFKNYFGFPNPLYNHLF
jgi:hypothetical protein